MSEKMQVGSIVFKGSPLANDSQFNKSLKHAVYFSRVIDMLERLVPPSGRYIFVSKKEGIEATCVFCGEINSHKQDCAWLEARKLLEELK